MDQKNSRVITIPFYIALLMADTLTRSQFVIASSSLDLFGQAFVNKIRPSIETIASLNALSEINLSEFTAVLENSLKETAVIQLFNAWYADHSTDQPITDALMPLSQLARIEENPFDSLNLITKNQSSQKQILQTDSFEAPVIPSVIESVVALDQAAAETLTAGASSTSAVTATSIASSLNSVSIGSVIGTVASSVVLVKVISDIVNSNQVTTSNYALQEITLWAGYPTGQPVDSQYFQNMLNNIENFNSTNPFKITQVNAYVSSPYTAGIDQSTKWYQLFWPENFANTIKSFKDKGIQLNTLIDYSSFSTNSENTTQKIYQSSAPITPTDPSDVQKDWLSIGWKEGQAPDTNGDMITYYNSIDPALAWFYDVQNELQKLSPASNLSSTLIIDPENSLKQSSFAAHQQYQALTMYGDEFRRDNPISGDIFETAVTLSAQSWSQAQGLVMDYPAVVTESTLLSFIENYNASLPVAAKNSNSLLSKNGDKISITYQTNSQGAITDNVYMQLYEPDFKSWIPEVNRISDDWYELNYALRKVPYMDNGQITVVSNTAPSSGSYTTNLTYSGSPVFDSSNGGSIIFSKDPINPLYPAQNINTDVIMKSYSAIDTNAKTITMTHDNRIDAQQSYHIYTTEIPIGATVPSLNTDKTKPEYNADIADRLYWMYSFENDYFGQNYTPVQFQNFIQFFVNNSKDGVAKVYDPFNNAQDLINLIPIDSTGGTIDNIAIYDYGVMVDDGVWGF